MLIKNQAIVLSSISYGDTGKVIRFYTQSSGISSFIAKGVYSKKNKINSLLSPLNFVELVYDDKKSGQLLHFKEIRQLHYYQNFHQNPEKISIGFFLAEILNSVLKEEEANPDLFKFLSFSFLEFDKKETIIADFHLWFLFQLTQFLGFYPLLNSELPYFNLEEGISTKTPPVNFSLSEEEFFLWNKLSKLDFFNQTSLQFNQKQRNLLLNLLLKYYELHISDFRLPNSLKVLNVVFE